jgi:hypothetical protein
MEGTDPVWRWEHHWIDRRRSVLAFFRFDGLRFFPHSFSWHLFFVGSVFWILSIGLFRFLRLVSEIFVWKWCTPTALWFNIFPIQMLIK